MALVEDNELLRPVLAKILKAGGHRVIDAASGEELLAQLQDAFAGDDAAVIDLLIADVRLPGMSGRELVHHAAQRCDVRATLYISDTPLHNVRAAAASRSGRSGFLRKPFGLRSFVDGVAALMEGAA